MKYGFLIIGILTVMLTGEAFTEDHGRGTMAENESLKKATFAGGCFWCMQPPFDELPGVVSTRAGYTGGTKKKPTYEEVSAGQTGHAEAVEIIYDSSQISYDELLEVFWKNIDPTTENAQFADKGSQYRTAVYYHNEEQKQAALASRKRLEDSGKFNDKPIVTKVEPAPEFYPAEDYHQDYYKKNPVHYQLYKKGSGREGYLREKWGEKKK